MANFDAQNTDRENSKSAPKSVARDNALKSSTLGSLQSNARYDSVGQQSNSGAGTEAHTETVPAGK